MAFEHVVLFRLREGADAAEAIEVLNRSRPEDAGLLSWVIARSLDDRKGVVIVERAVFADSAAFERFRESESHVAAGRFMQTRADWLIGDYVT